MRLLIIRFVYRVENWWQTHQMDSSRFMFLTAIVLMVSPYSVAMCWMRKRTIFACTMSMRSISTIWWVDLTRTVSKTYSCELVYIVIVTCFAWLMETLPHIHVGTFVSHGHVLCSATGFLTFCRRSESIFHSYQLRWNTIMRHRGWGINTLLQLGLGLPIL